MKFGSLKMNNNISEAIQKLITSRSMDMQYYGELSLNIVFHKTDSIPTAGVNFTNFMNFYYNEDFINGLNEKQLNFVFFHEIFHLLWDHPQRSICYDKTLSNYAQDMIINDVIIEHMGQHVEEPIASPLYIPKEYKDDKVFEILYKFLADKKEIYDRNKAKAKKEKGEGQGQGQEKGEGQGQGQEKGEGQGQGDDTEMGKYGVSKELEKIFDSLEQDKNGKGSGRQFDVHMADEVPQEVRDGIRDGIKDALKNRGLQTGNIEATLNKLKRKRKDYLKEIKRSLSQLKGFIKSPSYRKPNRRGIKGIKGKVKLSSRINVILDTSGSMCNEFNVALSYVFQNDIVMNFIQCDTQVQVDAQVTNKHELEKMKIKGLGGTVLMPAIDRVKEKYSKFNTVILTDGYTDNLDLSGMKKVLIITTDAVPPHSGNAKVIRIDEENRYS